MAHEKERILRLYGDRAGLGALVAAMALRLGWRAGVVDIASLWRNPPVGWTTTILVEIPGADGTTALVGVDVRGDQAESIGWIPPFAGVPLARLRADRVNDAARALHAASPMPAVSDAAKSWHERVLSGTTDDLVPIEKTKTREGFDLARRRKIVARIRRAKRGAATFSEIRRQADRIPMHHTLDAMIAEGLVLENDKHKYELTPAGAAWAPLATPADPDGARDTKPPNVTPSAAPTPPARRHQPTDDLPPFSPIPTLTWEEDDWT